MNRISREHMFMRIAHAAALRSTCYRRAIGAILVHKNNVISIGYNGPPSGQEHCTGANCPSTLGCSRALHAEENSIRRCGIKLSLEIPVDLYTTESPCFKCAELIADSGIHAVYYENEYRIRQGISHLLRCGVRVFRLTPSGYIIDAATEELVT